MGLFDKFFGNKEVNSVPAVPEVKMAPEIVVELPKPKAKPKAKPQKKNTNAPKDTATKLGEPWVDIVSVELDSENIGNGAFELDWNEFFVAKLVRAGYKGKDDQQIVDQWFQDVCRNVVMETFEQYEANNPRPLTGVQRRDIGDGRSEIS